MEEIDCYRIACPGMFRCNASVICIHPNSINDRIPDCPNGYDDYLKDFYFPTCPPNCTCILFSVFCKAIDTFEWNKDKYPYLSIRELSFISWRRGGRLFVGGGPEFFWVVKGGDQNFFSGSKGGTKIISVYLTCEQN